MINYIKSLAIVLLSAQLLFADDQALFTFLDRSTITLTEKQQKILAAREKSKSVEKIEIIKVNTGSLQIGCDVKINLERGGSIVILKITGRVKEKGAVRWIGEVAGSDFPYKIDVAEDHFYFAINYKSRVYSLEPFGDGLHILTKNNFTKKEAQQPPKKS